jgi:SP family facilitated glucose transporter-like MFS transporter 1
MEVNEWPSESITESRLSVRLILTVLICALGGSFQFGFSTGFVNNAEPYVKRYLISVGVTEEGADTEFRSLWSVAVSGFAMGGIVSTFLFPKIAQRVGRKAAILATTPFCFFSCYLIAFPSSWCALIVGRIMVGISAGGACAVVPTYITEIAPLELRGSLGTVHQLFITIGIFVAQLVSTEQFGFFGSDEKWQCCLVLPSACAFIMMLFLPFSEDSPAYLFQRYGEERAENALLWFRPHRPHCPPICNELQTIKEELSLSSKDAGIIDVLGDPLLWKPLLVGSIVNLSMQFSGIDAVFYYSTNVFHRAGIVENESQVYSTLISLCNVLITIPAMLCMDMAGRKVIQACGLSGMCASFVVMTFALVHDYHRLSVVAMTMSICFFALGPGCIAWFIIGELMPLHARSIATTVALTVNWMANMLVGAVFPQIEHTFDSYAFGTFVVSTALLALFTVACLPETKGNTILEIRAWFVDKAAKQYSNMGDHCEHYCSPMAQRTEQENFDVDPHHLAF